MKVDKQNMASILDAMVKYMHSTSWENKFYDDLGAYHINNSSRDSGVRACQDISPKLSARYRFSHLLPQRRQHNAWEVWKSPYSVPGPYARYSSFLELL